MNTQKQATYKVGGRVSVTLKDNTRIIHSPITRTPYGVLLIANQSLALAFPDGSLGHTILSVDQYDPPAPPWAAPNVRVIRSKNDQHIAVRVDNEWQIDGSKYAEWELELFGEWEVYGVAP